MQPQPTPAVDLEAVAAALRNAANRGYEPSFGFTKSPIQPGELAVAACTWLPPKSPERDAAHRAVAKFDEAHDLRRLWLAMSEMTASRLAAMLEA